MIAGVHVTSGARICFIEEGREVPSLLRLMDWTDKKHMEWVATSFPVAGSARAFRPRPTCSVIYPAQNILCRSCRRLPEDGENRDHQDDPEEEQAPSDDRFQQHEIQEMMKEDCNVLVTTIVRPREQFKVQSYAGTTVESLHRNLSRRKRVSTSTHVMLKLAEVQEALVDNDTIYWTPQKSARGGRPHRITIQYDEHRFEAAFAIEDTVNTMLTTLGRPQAALRWCHYWLHHDVDLVDFEDEKLYLVDSVEGLTCFRTYLDCINSGFISLAELQRWRALPGDLPQVWATDDPQAIRTRALCLRALVDCTCDNMQEAKPWRSTENELPMGINGLVPWSAIQD